MKVNNEEYVLETEILETLEEMEDEEMSHEQKITAEKLKRNLEITDKETLSELKDELTEIDGLKEKHVYKILEIMPEHPSTVNTIFSKERIKLEDSDVEKILEITTSVET